VKPVIIKLNPTIDIIFSDSRLHLITRQKTVTVVVVVTAEVVIVIFNN